MMKCIVVDDDPMQIKLLEEHISKVDYLEYKGSFQNPITAINLLHEKSVDLIFVDVEMPEMNGIEFIKSLRKPHPIIIVTTTHKNFALRAFQHNAIDYVLKPYDLSRFLIAVSKAKDYYDTHNTVETNDDVFFVKQGSMMVKLHKLDVLWIKGMADYVILNTATEKYIINSTMKVIEKKFHSKKFMRINRSYIVRVDLIENIEDHAVFYCDKLFPIGKTYIKKVNTALNKL